MKLFNRVVLTTFVAVALFSCSSKEEQFIGTWVAECEEEVMGLTFLSQKESLTLNKDNSFTQCFTYFNDDSLYDTLATTSINGSWTINKNCLEMEYDTTTIVVTCEDEDIKDIFYDNLLGNVVFANDELAKAHKEDAQYGIQNAVVKDSVLISKENIEDKSGEVIYTKAQ